MQTQFSEALLNPDLPVPEGILNANGQPASKRFDVYRNNVVASLIGALRDGYPVVEKVVGAQFFDAMAAVYVRANPPKTPLMILYGGEFPTFLDTFEPAQQVPYLADIARLEWARREAYHAADAAPADLSSLGGMDESRLMAMRFVLHPSLRIVSSPYPVKAIWDLNMGYEATLASQAAQSVLIVRPSEVVNMSVIDAGTRALLTHIGNSQTLGRAAEAAGKEDDYDLARSLSLVFGAAAISRTIE